MIDRPVAQPNFRDAWPAIIRTRELYERGELTSDPGIGLWTEASGRTVRSESRIRTKRSTWRTAPTIRKS